MKSIKAADQKVESIPDGFTAVPAIDGIQYVVPEFLIPMADHIRNTREKLSASKVRFEAGGVRMITSAMRSSSTNSFTVRKF